MGCLLNFPTKLCPRQRRWKPWYPLWRQGYLSLDGHHCDAAQIAGHGNCNCLLHPSYNTVCADDCDDKYVVCADECDDRYVVSCGIHSTDRRNVGTDQHEGNPKNQERNDGNGQYGSKYDSNHEICEDSIGPNAHHKPGSNEGSHDLDNRGGSKEATEDEAEDGGLLRGDDYGRSDGAFCQDYTTKKKAMATGVRARGLEGYWIRQSYLHSAYKFTRRRSLCERAMVHVRKLRTAWGMMRGMYTKQANGVQGQLRCISNSPRVHHSSFLLLSKRKSSFHVVKGASPVHS